MLKKYGYSLSLKQTHLMPQEEPIPGNAQRALCGSVVAAVTDERPVYTLCELCRVRAEQEAEQPG